VSGALIVIGPSGNGKSSLAHALAERLERPFVEGDKHHPLENIAKMARGEPLTDEDRAPFLASLGRALAEAKHGAVASCSALRRAYRDRLRSFDPQAVLVWPQVPPEELARRMTLRKGHFMPPCLLEDQLAIFEPPADDEQTISINGCLPVSEQVELIIRSLNSSSS
jgi:gluconokinase